LEAFGGKPGRQYFDAPADAVGEQSLLHGVRGRNYGIQLIALRAAEAASQAAGDLARQQRHVVMQVLFEERVVRGNYGRALLSGESKPCVMRQKRGMDVYHVEFARSQLRKRSAQPAPRHDAILRVSRYGASRHAAYRWIGCLTRFRGCW